MNYLQAQNSANCRIEIKKSEFIALAAPCNSREQAMSLLEQSKKDFPNARHYCWAYIVGDPNNAATMASSDDGEPSGTAGKPILNVLLHKNIGDLMLIIVRYFGGIKLGAGGLVRAYSQAADAVVNQLDLIEPIILQPWLFTCDFAQEQYLRHWLGLQQGHIERVDYSERVSLYALLPIQEQAPEESLAAFNIHCQAQF